MGDQIIAGFRARLFSLSPATWLPCLVCLLFCCILRSTEVT